MSISNSNVNVLFDLDEALASSNTTPPITSKTTSFSSSSTISSVRLLLDDLPTVSVAGDCVCCVCMEGFKYTHDHHGGKQLPCGHVYHHDCIFTWLSSSTLSCPICRYSITYGDNTNFVVN
ncbi:hypothetical protein RND81_07G090500 [Saponaria officinalis]|uniref:RING-type E3 ubiquitin transferase n=1 Tax=Saponaria officinalis TaxID=3572 RepID=A0AAW1JTA8_SAPOF